MEKELWAVVRICVHPNQKKVDELGNWKVNHYHWHVVREWHYPKWIINRHRPFFTWVHALYQVRFKFHHVTFRYCGYYPDTKEIMSSKRQLAISAAKAQVTKIENVISDYEARISQTLFQNYSDDPIHKKLLEKLEQKKFNLQQAVMMAVEETI